MKRRILFWCVVCTGLQLSASKKLTNFDFPLESEFTIPSSSPLNLPFDLSAPMVTTNSGAKFESEDRKANLVEHHITFKCFTSKITSLVNRKFDFLKEVHLNISENGSAEEEKAYANSTEDGITSELSFISTGGNLKKHLVAKEVKIRINAVTEKITTTDTELKCTLIFP